MRNLIQPCMIKESANGYTPVRLEDELFGQRKIFLTDEIDICSATSLIKQLMILSHEDPSAPISLYISSSGGSIDSGMSIIDCMSSIKAEVDTYCVGLTASMAAVIFSCGCKRFMFPSGKLMIHDPMIPETGGNALKLKAVSDSLMEYRSSIASLLAGNCGKTTEEILELTRQDTYFNAEEALAFGLADQIIEGENL